MTIQLADFIDNFDFVEKLQNRRENYFQRGPICAGIPTGFTDLDILGGLEEHSLNVLASRPAMGKTALAIDIALNIAFQKQIGNLENVNTIRYLNFESTNENFLYRLITKTTEVEKNKILTGGYVGYEFQEMVGAFYNLKKLNFMILDDLPENEDEVFDFIDLNCNSGDVVFVDYLDLIINSFPSEPYISGVNFIRRLKLLAIKKKLTFVILSQLLKKVDDRQGWRPMLSDLPYGVLANHADKIMLLFRAECYDPFLHPGRADLTIAKNRNGENGNSLKLYFHKGYAKFTDYPLPNFDEDPNYPLLNFDED